MSDLWEKANKVSEMGYKVNSAANIVELVAESISDDINSGALWAAADLLKDLSDRIENLALDIMAIEHEQQVEKPKGKKK